MMNFMICEFYLKKENARKNADEEKIKMTCNLTLLITEKIPWVYSEGCFYTGAFLFNLMTIHTSF
jgi:hypothetical protein